MTAPSTPVSYLTHTQALQTTSQLTWRDRMHHVLARLGIRREHHRVKPGLYALNAPSPESPVFVTSNYTLSFDALRSSLKEQPGYLLVLDTFGVNVWCAAGKGTFSTAELVNKIEQTDLKAYTAQRTLILPQLGASGVAAHEVRRQSRFKVEFGPVRADDLPEYLKTRTATPAMRQVRFNLLDRLVLIPVELVHYFLPTAAAAAVSWLLAGWPAALAAVSAYLSSVVLFPILLPWLPSREFSLKGFILGALTSLPWAFLALLQPLTPTWLAWARALSILLVAPAVVAYLALNFTGSTPLTSPTGVQREMTRYIRWMLGLSTTGVIVLITQYIIGLV